MWISAIRRRLPNMTPRDLVQVVHVLAEWTLPLSSSSLSATEYATIIAAEEALITEAALRAYPLLPSFTPVDLSTLALALARLNDAGKEPAHPSKASLMMPACLFCISPLLPP